MPTSPDDRSQASAESLFAAWLAARSSGNGRRFESVLREHPAQAAELRQLLAQWELVERLRREQGLDGTLSERLRSRYGSEVDPKVTLTLESEGPESSGQSSDVLMRLSERRGVTHRYRPEGEIARGGMGAVLGVFDEDLRRHLAMKVMLAGEKSRDASSVDPRLLSRFLEEAQVTSQLDHPGIVPVHELGLDAEGRVYFTMKLVKGRTLKDAFEEFWRGEGEWTQPRLLALLLKVCEAMSYAHAKGVIHRDLKPANVMVGRFGEVYVMDWGLARVLGRDDAKDIRVRPEPALKTSELRSERRDHAGESPDSPLYTLDGDVVGTPAYMPPEQAAGRLAEMGPHSDVYAVGALLYHLLAGHMPYLPPGTRTTNYAILRWVQDGPPKPLHQVARSQPAELVAICERAMEREPTRRYADMRALASDLQAYLEGRVVPAYETGAVAELKKWVVRNKPLAASLAAAVLLLVVGLTVSLSLFVQARSSRENVLRLSAFQELEDLEALAQRLWPAHPEHAAAYREWMKRAEMLVASLDPGEHGVGHRSQLAEIEARALPQTEQEREAGRRTHPRFTELEVLQRELDARRRALDVRTGVTPFEATELEASARVNDTQLLSRLARKLTAPTRTEFGSEAQGLALARRAAELSGSDPAARLEANLTLAFALLSNGLDEELRSILQTTDAEVTSELQAVWQKRRAELEDALDTARQDAQAAIAALEARVADLEVELAERREWSFEAEHDRWWHGQLVKLVAALEAFAHPETGTLRGHAAWGVARRLEWAEAVAALTLEDPRWPAAIASIADETECPQYRGLELRPQLGLVPIGRDPRSGFWEFAHLQSGVAPERGADGALVLTPECGLVFVLLPGGRFHMGAQAEDSTRPNHDPRAKPDEAPVHEVALSPFFLSKYEMSQAQWEAFTGSNPSSTRPPSSGITPLHPVEMVSWLDCRDVLWRLGLALPSEAQWEYAARAGTDTPWSTGTTGDSLAGYANIADKTALDAGATWTTDLPEMRDGFVMQAPPDALLPNAFGLHHVHGNVAEWVQDAFADTFYLTGPSKDPVQDAGRYRLIRGGGMQGPSLNARSAVRLYIEPHAATFFYGVRPARAVER
jgi:formylglycine-generating enzyme required for sulfatase activity/serine/threonine protein kinase